MIVAPALEEIADVAGLETRAGLAPAVGHGKTVLPCLRECSERFFLGNRQVGPAGVAQHIDMEARADPSACEIVHHGNKVADDPFGWLVAHAHHDRGRGDDRLRRECRSGLRHHGRGRITRPAHDDEADGGVPETDDEPRRRKGEQRQQQEIDGIEAACRQRERDEKQQSGERRRHQGQEQEAAAENMEIGQGIGSSLRP